MHIDRRIAIYIFQWLIYYYYYYICYISDMELTFLVFWCNAHAIELDEDERMHE